MSLQNFLGCSSEIAIVDFLAENNEYAYTISEISEFTGLSRTTVHHKLPMLIYNRLIEIDGQAGHVKTYRLARNDFMGTLITAVYQHSFMMADVDDEDKALEQIKTKIDRHPEYSENRYYNPATDGPLDAGPSSAEACEPAARIEGRDTTDAA
ncbi:MAG: helix-turn-helix domain-containing protein [Methanocella sp.]